MNHNDDNLKRLVEHHEGRRKKLYKCSEGYWTIGVGHNIEVNGLPDHIIDALFEYDLDIAYRDARTYLGSKFDDLNEVRQNVLVDMSFQLGLAKLSDFKKLKVALLGEDYTEAAHQMMDSKWAIQTPHRATQLAEMMESGELLS